MEKVIAQATAMLNPKQSVDVTHAFQKCSSDGEFVAGGVGLRETTPMRSVRSGAKQVLTRLP